MNAQAIGHLAMLLFSALVAGSFSLGGLMAGEIDPGAFTALRLALAAVLVFVIALMQGGIPRSAVTAPWRYLVLGGLFGFYFVLMFEGLKTAPPVNAAAVFTLTPLITAGFAWVLMRQVLTPRMALALFLGALGAIWVIFRADIGALLAFRIGTGEAIYFWGCVAHALYTPLVVKLNRGEPQVVLSLGVLAGGAVVVGLWAAPALWAVDWAALPAIVWWTLAYVTIFASAATVTLLQIAALRLPSAKVMAYTYLVPSWVALWELALGNAVPPLLVLLGVGLTIVALLLLLREA